MKKIVSISIYSFLFIQFFFVLSFTHAQSFTVDFSKWIDEPLVKTKFCVYMTPLAQPEDLIKSNELLSDLNIHAYRYEYGWGKNYSLDYEQINKKKDHLLFKIDSTGNYVDRFFDGIHNSKIKPLFTHCYTPKCLVRDASSRAKSMVNNLEDWKAINKKYAKHWRDKGYKAPYYEIWNEPDLKHVFFDGTISDYCNLYKWGAAGVSEGDPDALIGGMALCYRFDWLETWLDSVQKNKWQMDFLSGHAYDEWHWMVDMMRLELMIHNMKTIPMYLTEWASFDNNDNNQVFHTNSLIEKSVSAMRFFRDVREFLQVPDLTQVYWAQYRDAEWLVHGNWEKDKDKFGLITNDNNQKKPLYHAFKMYGEMPVDRYKVTPETLGDLYVMASRDDHNAGIVIWNTSQWTQSVVLNISNLPFEKGEMQVYRIDPKHGSIRECGNECENKLKYGSSIEINSKHVQWKDSIPREGVVYLKLKDGSQQSLLTPKQVGNYVKTLYWFPDRSKKWYSDFDPKTSIARLGAENSDTADAVIAAVIDDPQKKLTFSVNKDGVFKTIDQNSLFGVRIDFQATDGTYSKSILLHNGIYNASGKNDIPWGTKKNSEVIIHVDEFNKENDFVFLVTDYAPKDWNKKRIIITYILRNTGADTKARIILK